MAIVKSLGQAPLGLDQLADDEDEDQEPDLEITIEDPEAIDINAGGVNLLHMNKEDDEIEFGANLAEYIPEGELQSLASELVADYESDVAARKDWVQTYVDGLELLGLKIEERSEPWEGACGVYHPLLSEALVKFQAETMMATFPAMGPVKTKVMGRETTEKKQAAERVADDMNHQLMDVMQEYRPEHERMLWGLGLSGNAFKKIYEDPYLERQVSIFVAAEDVVVPYGASSLQSSPRVTHVMRKTVHDIRRLQIEGFYRDIDLGEPVQVMDEVEKKIAEKLGFKATSDDRYKLLEMSVDLDLPGFEHTGKDGEQSGLALPYIITIEKGTNNVLSIRRNWKEGDKKHKKRQHFVHYGYIPGFGFYYFGLIHLIGAFAKSGTSLLRQLVDAGSLANLPGGFKTRGLRVKGDDTPIAPGEFRDVDVPSGTMRDNLMPLPYKEPSQVLMALLGQIVEEGRKFAGAADLQISDMSAQAPVGTTLAILERTLKTMSAIQARIYYSMKQEFRLLKEIIAENCPEDYPYDPVEGSRHAMRSDYESVEVIPVADPNASTMAQKVVQWQAAIQLAQTDPQIYDMPYLHRQMLDAMGIANYQKLIPLPEDMKPRDPVTENMNVLMNKPVKAFLYQDHEAHIKVHMALGQDPHVQQLLAQSPDIAQKITSAMEAHMAEHLAYEYRKQIEQRMGIALPKYDENDEDDQNAEAIPPEIEVQVSQMAAQAAQQLLQQHQQEAQQQKNQQTAQDPIIQMQQQELQLKAQKQQMDAQRDQAELQIKRDQLQIERDRINSQAQVAGAQLAVKSISEQTSREHKSQIEGFKTGIDAIKHHKELLLKKDIAEHQANAQKETAAKQTPPKKDE